MIEAELEKLTTSLENGVRAAANAIVDDILRAELRIRLNQQQEELTHWKAELTASQDHLDAQYLSLTIDPRQALKLKRREPKNPVSDRVDDDSNCLADGINVDTVLPEIGSLWIRKRGGTLREVIAAGYYVTLRTVHTDLESSIGLKEFFKRYTLSGGSLEYVKPHVRSLPGDLPRPLEKLVVKPRLGAELPEVGSLWIHKRRGSLRKVVRTYLDNRVELETLETGKTGITELKWLRKAYISANRKA